jgi:hypothetical protein
MDKDKFNVVVEAYKAMYLSAKKQRGAQG